MHRRFTHSWMALVVLAAGCGGAQPTETPATPPTASEPEPRAQAMPAPAASTSAAPMARCMDFEPGLGPAVEILGGRATIRPPTGAQMRPAMDGRDPLPETEHIAFELVSSDTRLLLSIGPPHHRFFGSLMVSAAAESEAEGRGYPVEVGELVPHGPAGEFASVEMVPGVDPESIGADLLYRLYLTLPDEDGIVVDLLGWIPEEKRAGCRDWLRQSLATMAVGPALADYGWSEERLLLGLAASEHLDAHGHQCIPPGDDTIYYGRVETRPEGRMRFRVFTHDGPSTSVEMVQCLGQLLAESPIADSERPTVAVFPFGNF